MKRTIVETLISLLEAGCSLVIYTMTIKMQGSSRCDSEKRKGLKGAYKSDSLGDSSGEAGEEVIEKY